VSAPTLSRPSSSTSPSSPPALRATRPGWRDPRLAVGVGLVALCGLLGARLLASADDTVAVWALAGPGVAGERLANADLEVVRMRFADPAQADRYVSAADQLPAGAVLTRGVGPGELLPRAALGDQQQAQLVQLPITVAAQAVPSTLVIGTAVDLWVTPRDSRRAVRVLDDVPVLALPRDGSSLGTSEDRQVVVGLDARSQEALPEALALLADGTPVLTARVG
jgi:hypothetical protein